MKTVHHPEFCREVCRAQGCWTSGSVKEAGVEASLGAGWKYFLIERHYSNVACVGRGNCRAEMCDALAVPLQVNRKKLTFLELKSSGKHAKAVSQIRAGVEAILEHGIPHDVTLTAEIWYCREPKATVRTRRFIEVNGRKIFVRRRNTTDA